ncbi:sigma-70 family RNA polymerase sigma factor [soil metagenome]
MSVDKTALFVAHRSSLVHYADGILRDHAGAEDVVQESWVRFSTVPDADKIANPVAYLYRIVRNLALDGATRRSADAIRSAGSLTELVRSDAPGADRILYYRDELRVTAAALAELPERTRTAFRMYRLEGRTLQAIADHLGVSVVRAHQLVKDAILHAAHRLDGSGG